MTTTPTFESKLIRSLDTDALKAFIEAKKDQRNDLWSAASALEQEALTLKRQGNDVNWEVAVAVVELRKRDDG